MPLPKPRKRESRDHFVSRCHSSLADEFPDSSQRHAVCLRQWRSKSETSMPATKQRNRRQPSRLPVKNGIVRLNVPLSVKADSVDPTNHTFEGLAAVWDLDLGNDIIDKGAFKKTIQDWKSGPDPIPLLNSHDHYDIFAALGQAISLKETVDGLWSKWELLPGPEGDAVLTRLTPSPTTGKSIVGKMSIGFEPIKFSYEQPEGTTSYFDRIRHLEQVNLKEVSLVLFPMAPGAAIDVTSVKMFLKSAQQTDPKSVDLATRLELRRLASRIGNLLKKQRSPDEEEELEDDDESQAPSARRPVRTKGRTQPIDDQDDDEDSDETELEDEIEDTGEEDIEDLGEEEIDEVEETTEETIDVPPNKSAKGKTSAKAPAKVSPKAPAKDGKKTADAYEFQEALQQRLQKVTLKHKVSVIGKDS